jgi:hypothetical protein
MTVLPTDVARCHGSGEPGDWREGCEDCQRRTSPPADPDRVWRMTPPAVIVFECEARIAPGGER